jgi:hypothetical protein
MKRPIEDMAAMGEDVPTAVAATISARAGEKIGGAAGRANGNSGGRGSGGGSAAPERGTLDTILGRSSPFSSETGALAMGEHDISTCSEKVKNSKILVIGAGGLGCEILKDLAMRYVLIDYVCFFLASV